jgi:serine/threonine protein kinase
VTATAVEPPKSSLRSRLMNAARRTTAPPTAAAAKDATPSMPAQFAAYSTLRAHVAKNIGLSTQAVAATQVEKTKLNAKQEKIFLQRLKTFLAKDLEAAKFIKTHAMGSTSTLKIDGKEIYLTDSITGKNGGFGVLRMGLTASGHRVAVKVLRLGEGDGPRKKTHYSSEAEARQELEVLEEISPPTRPLQAVRIKGADGVDKLYVVMAPQQGDAAKLFALLQPQHQGIAMASMLLNLAESGLRLNKRGRYGTMHGDIKPANILFDHRGTIGLSDMGTAYAFTNAAKMRQAGTFMCTPEYLPSEALLPGTFHGVAADLWSVGITAYECLLGKSLFVAPKNLETRTQTALSANAVYQQWYSSLPRKKDKGGRPGAIDDFRLNAEGRTCSITRGYCRGREILGKDLNDFLIDTLLNPDPHQRLSWRLVADYANKILQGHDAEARLQQAVASLVGADVQDRAVDYLLRSHRDAVQR